MTDGHGVLDLDRSRWARRHSDWPSMEVFPLRRERQIIVPRHQVIVATGASYFPDPPSAFAPQPAPRKRGKKINAASAGRSSSFIARLAPCHAAERSRTPPRSGGAAKLPMIGINCGCRTQDSCGLEPVANGNCREPLPKLWPSDGSAT